MPVTFQLRAEDGTDSWSPCITVPTGEQVPQGRTVTLPIASTTTGSFLLHLNVGCKRAHLGLPGQVTLRGEVSGKKSPLTSCAPEISFTRKWAFLKLGTVVENKALSKCISFQTLIIIFLPNLFDPLIKAKWKAAENMQQPGKAYAIKPVTLLSIHLGSEPFIIQRG